MGKTKVKLKIKHKTYYSIEDIAKIVAEKLKGKKYLIRGAKISDMFKFEEDDRIGEENLIIMKSVKEIIKYIKDIYKYNFLKNCTIPQKYPELSIDSKDNETEFFIKNSEGVVDGIYVYNLSEKDEDKIFNKITKWIKKRNNNKI